MAKILVFGGLAESLVNFRGPMLKEMAKLGYQVIACAPEASPETKNDLHSLGVEYQNVSIDRTSLNPIKDFYKIIRFFKLLQKNKPEIFFGYTLKPVIYGSIAAKLAGVSNIYSMITGLGYTFSSHELKGRFLRKIVQILYYLSLKMNKKIFFQNPDDFKLFVRLGILADKQRAVLVSGSGVDLNYYSKSPLPEEPIFLMIARLLKDKGVKEYVQAAIRVNKLFPYARFLLVGRIDPNPNSIKISELRLWKKNGVIEYLGYLNDVRSVIQRCRCYVLPSYYREGVPRTVLEAMSMGRPIITTDAPGCRETVKLTNEGQRQKKLGKGIMRGENGFLIRVRDVESLVIAMKQFLEFPHLAERMAKRSREIAEEKFDVNKVNALIMEAMDLI